MDGAGSAVSFVSLDSEQPLECVVPVCNRTAGIPCSVRLHRLASRVW